MSAKPDEAKKPVDVWAKYEQLKAEIPKELSPEEYQAECKRIADELGI